MSLYFSIKKMIESGIRDKIWAKYKLTQRKVKMQKKMQLTSTNLNKRTVSMKD